MRFMRDSDIGQDLVTQFQINGTQGDIKLVQRRRAKDN